MKVTAHPILHVGRFARVTVLCPVSAWRPVVWHTVVTVDGPRVTPWGKRPGGSWWSWEMGPEWWA